ncbi:nickel-dependent hydrogenase large subunit [Mesorhizobium sp. ArgA1]
MTDLPVILVVDDEVRSLESIKRILSDEFDLLTAPDTDVAMAHFENGEIEVVLCDQRMPGLSGIEFLKKVRERWPETVRMIISGYTDAHDIIDGVNDAGIYQYITKPWQPQALSVILHKAVQLYRTQREAELLAVEMRMAPSTAARIVDERKRRLKSAYDVDDGIIRRAESPMAAVCDALRMVAPYDIPVVLTGESGTGKELAARALGALARQVVNSHPLARDMVRLQGGSVHARVVARLLEIALTVIALERWLRAVHPQNPFSIPDRDPRNGAGIGLVEAARGSLGHWLKVRDGRIEIYQIIAPTTWNFSPRDRDGMPGPLEQALHGLPVEGPDSVLVQHVVRSFDPCMVCTVH